MPIYEMGGNFDDPRFGTYRYETARKSRVKKILEILDKKENDCCLCLASVFGVFVAGIAMMHIMHWLGPINVPISSAAPRKIYACGDLNSDGIADLIVESRDGNRHALYGCVSKNVVSYMPADEFQKETTEEGATPLIEYSDSKTLEAKLDGRE